MAKHTVTRDELDGWLQQDERVTFASHFGGPHAKRLEVTLQTRLFIVTDHNVETYIGSDKDLALAAYNAAP
jgi:hypothetical protein